MSYKFNSKKELVDDEGKIVNLAMAAIRLNEKQKKIDELEETHRMQLAGISTISGCNTLESLNNCIIQRDNPYWTIAFDDVLRTMSREILLIKKLQAAEEREKMLREAVEEARDGIEIIVEDCRSEDYKWQDHVKKLSLPILNQLNEALEKVKEEINSE